MSKITDIIFKGEKHYITSNFGSRSPIKTSAGTTSKMHKGTDYGTNGKKIAQYAIEDGVVYSCGTDTTGAKYVTIKYPRINKRFLHWHLDSIVVKKGQSVSKYTKIGTTGQTGKATGIHLHLGIIDLSNNTYIDPEKYAKEYNEPTTSPSKYTGGSIVEALNSVGVDSSFANRKKIAQINGISNYKGTPTQNTTLLNLFKSGKLVYKTSSNTNSAESKKTYLKTSYKGSSLVDALRSIKVDSSFTYRKKLAKANGINLYIGSPNQNTKLLNLLKQGKLIKA